MRRPIFAAVALALTVPTLAQAQSIGTPIKKKMIAEGKATLDPAKGYILLIADGVTASQFLRLPDDQARAAWEDDRKAALARETDKYAQAHAKWVADADLARKTNQPVPAEPVAPTLQTVTIDPLETRDMANFDPEGGYAKVSPRPYLLVVKPGTYVYYMHDGFNGGSPIPDGVCFCMGTVRFEVKPGVITNLGSWLDAVPAWNDDMDVVRMERRKHADERRAAGKDPDMTDIVPLIWDVPAELKGWPVVKAEFHASGKINNYAGMVVTRVPPVPGVLAYDRDRVIDAATGTALPDPSFLPMKKVKP